MVLNIINQMWSTVRKKLIDNSIIKTCKKIYLYNCRLSCMIRGRRRQYCQKCVICLSFEGMIFFTFCSSSKIIQLENRALDKGTQYNGCRNKWTRRRALRNELYRRKYISLFITFEVKLIKHIYRQEIGLQHRKIYMTTGQFIRLLLFVNIIFLLEPS